VRTRNWNSSHCRPNAPAASRTPYIRMVRSMFADSSAQTAGQRGGFLLQCGQCAHDPELNLRAIIHSQSGG
jgi:hypothetical protein